jgi:hypothetical protein
MELHPDPVDQHYAADPACAAEKAERFALTEGGVRIVAAPSVVVATDHQRVAMWVGGVTGGLPLVVVSLTLLGGWSGRDVERFTTANAVQTWLVSAVASLGFGSIVGGLVLLFGFDHAKAKTRHTARAIIWVIGSLLSIAGSFVAWFFVALTMNPPDE